MKGKKEERRGSEIKVYVEYKIREHVDDAVFRIHEEFLLGSIREPFRFRITPSDRTARFLLLLFANIKVHTYNRFAIKYNHASDVLMSWVYREKSWWSQLERH